MRTPLSRRQLLQVGSLGMLGLTLPDLLQARAAAPSRNRSEKSCIFIVQYGGMSHVDSLDPKPDAPEGMRGPYKPIATRIPGVRFGELLPRLASLAGDFCVIRSMSHRNGGHDGGMHVCMTGNSRPDASTPYFGSVLAKVRPSPPTIPSYVWIQNLAGDVKPYYLTGGILGPTYSPLRIGQDLDIPPCPVSASRSSSRRRTCRPTGWPAARSRFTTSSRPSTRRWGSTTPRRTG